ncbi:hypothetical protein BJY01DRAFT_246954 [Aspergillus pseudoustus]|uniref:Rhodopsin domain-containing protein n=1 Tax=Aspergillus pseudoustus TaxID=1810923 RepID=A0ABR4K4D2_9EURO
MADSQLHDVEQNTLGMDLIIIGSIFVGLVWPAFALRWWARKLIHGWGWDDNAILCATILFTVYTAVAMACAVLLSRSATTLLLTSVVLYIMTMFSLKASLGAFFLRICIRRSQRIVIYISLLLMTIITLLYTGIVIFQCGAPQHAIGHFYNHNISCVAGSVLQGLGYAHGVTNALTDINFLFLGIWTLQQSQMRPRDKALVGLILSVGTMYVPPSVLCRNVYKGKSLI